MNRGEYWFKSEMRLICKMRSIKKPPIGGRLVVVRAVGIYSTHLQPIYLEFADFFLKLR